MADPITNPSEATPEHSREKHSVVFTMYLGGKKRNIPENVEIPYSGKRMTPLQDIFMKDHLMLPLRREIGTRDGFRTRNPLRKILPKLKVDRTKGTPYMSLGVEKEIIESKKDAITSNLSTLAVVLVA